MAKILCTLLFIQSLKVSLVEAQLLLSEGTCQIESTNGLNYGASASTCFSYGYGQENGSVRIIGDTGSDPEYYIGLRWDTTERIKSVLLLNRQDCCWGYMVGADVRVGKFSDGVSSFPVLGTVSALSNSSGRFSAISIDPDGIEADSVFLYEEYHNDYMGLRLMRVYQWDLIVIIHASACDYDS